MRAFKVLLPIVFGIAITFGALLGIANASSELNSPASPNGTIIYVHLYNDSGTYDGKSWDTAYKDLQDALAEAKSGDQIWVARGWYVTGNNRSDSFNLVPGVALYGGFYPAGGADEFSERDWENYRTILSGDVGQDDTPKVNGVVTTTDHIVGINSDHVVVADGTSTPITGNTVLDGFFITAGQANGSYPDNHGGGFYCDGSIGGECSPSLANLAFSGNYAGSGGAMYNDGDYGISLPSLKNVTFSGNSANSGGAMLNSSSNPDLWDVVFSDNSADSGGAIYNSYCSPSLENVTFSGNLAEYYGGAMYNNGHGGTSSPTLNRVTFYGNSADKGGAMYNHGREGNSSPSLSNVTFSGNDAEYGGAMFSTGTDGTSSPGLNNIILWGNTAAISGSQMYNEDISVTITTSLVQGGITGSGVHNENSTVTDGGGNLSADPDFVRDPDPGTDGNWDGVDDDYGDLHLMVGSPAIDTGTDSAISLPTDLDGNPRRVDGDGDGTAIVDMGAYEYNCPTGSILYVDHTASGTGSSWADAKPDLALGLELIVYCPHVSQVWVATGVYTPGIHREDSFELVPGVAVYGGFDPAGGADQFSERDWTSYPTILSGDIGGNDTHTDGVVMSATHIVGCNSYHVVTADGTNMPITAATVLDGFTITAGQAFTITAGQANDSYDLTNMMGGGFYCDGSGSGAECSPSLRNMIFSGNWADYRGGAMYNGGGYGGTSSPSLVDVTFSGNSADVGGAMYNNGHGGTSSPSLTNVVFSGNWANSSGGAMNNFGNFGTSSPNLENVTFSGNSAGINGGAMYNYGGGYGGASSPGLVDVTFSGNSAYRGGAMFSSSWNNGICSPSLTNVTFSGNEGGWGGAMSNRADFGTTSPTLTNVVFSGNSAGSGGAIVNRNSSPSLTNVTFSGNSAENGGAIHNVYTSASLSNIILWGNTAVISGSQIYNDETTVAITTSLVQGGVTGSGIYNENSTVVDGGGNLDADPDFVRDPNPGSDGNWDGVDDDYGDLHLMVGSPAIDTGTDSAISLPTDLDGNPRVLDGNWDGTATVDMGAYEFPGYQVLSLSPGGDPVTTADGVLTFEAPGALPQTIHITYTPLTTPTHSTGDFMFAGVVFHLEATDENGDPLVTISPPLSLTIAYDEAALPPEVDEADLELRRYDLELGEWVPLPVIDRDLAADTLTVLLGHVSEFALLDVELEVYLPLVEFPNP